MTKLEALAEVADMGKEIASYGGRLASWAYSVDAIDRFPAEAFRRRASRLSQAMAPFTDSEVDEIARALEGACAGDEYAKAEIAGRFRSGVRRARLATAVRRHPRAARFSTLIEAIERGRYTKAQWTLAQRLATEAA